MSLALALEIVRLVLRELGPSVVDAIRGELDAYEAARRAADASETLKFG